MGDNLSSPRASGTRRAFLSTSAIAAASIPLLGTAEAAAASGLPGPPPDPGLRTLLNQVDPARIEATIQRLISFGTRHTLSSQDDPVRGIGAATNWVYQQMLDIAATSNGAMTVQKQTFIQPVANRIPTPTPITNVIATIQGTASPQRYYVVTGHLDSRVTDVMDFTSDAPGADDDGSGVAVVLELARLFATAPRFPGTLVLATVAGEEQGLYGSAFMAAQMAAAGNDVQGMFSNDIVGASQAWDGTKPDPHSLRLFVEGIPTAATAAQIATMQSTGGENDGVSHQLGRFVAAVSSRDLTGIDVRVVWRRDRFLRGSDHLSFEQHGYPAARLTEPRENFFHEHQNTRVEDGHQFGDLIDFVDFDYIARVVKVNAAALWALATAPGTPKGVQIHTAPPGTFSGTNLTTLSWNSNPESDVVSYEVVLRETTAADWTSAIDVGDLLTVDPTSGKLSVNLDISKDNVQMGLRAVAAGGHRSPVAFPVVVN